MVTTPDNRPANERLGIDVASLRIALVAVTVLLVPFMTRSLLIVDHHSPHFNFPLLGTTTIGVYDIVLVLLAITAAPLVVNRTTYRGWSVALAGIAVMTLVTGIWAVLDPTPHAIVRCIRLAGITGLVATVRHMPFRSLRLAVIWPLTVSVIIQGSWALMQTFVWQNGDFSRLTARFGDVWTQGYGTMHGGYGMAQFSLLAVAGILASGAFQRLHPVMWAGVVIGSASISASFGRSAALGMLAIAVFYLIGSIVLRKRELLIASLSAFTPMAIGMWVSWSGWALRASEAINGIQNGRELLIARSLTVIRMSPMIGVGPGDYGPTLGRLGPTNVDYTVVHNLGLLVTAEYGIPLGLLFVVWIAALGILSILTSFRAMALFASIVPFMIWDHPHISYAYGLVQLGIWLALLDYLWSRRDRTRDTTPSVTRDEQRVVAS